jgi:MFS family permease
MAIGTLYGIANIGTALGPFIGGLLTEQLSWRWVFFLNVPLAAVAIFCCLRWLPSMPPAGATARIDWVGLVLVSSAIVAVAYAADRGGEGAGARRRCSDCWHSLLCCSSYSSSWSGAYAIR